MMYKNHDNCKCPYIIYVNTTTLIDSGFDNEDNADEDSYLKKDED